MEAQTDGRAWRAVQDDLDRILKVSRDPAGRRYAARLHHRAAVVRLRRALSEAAEPGAVAEGALGALDAELEGLGTAPVLATLAPAAVAEALARLQQALAADAGHLASLRAAAALATAGAIWREAVAWLERLARTGAQAPWVPAVLARVADLRWHELGDAAGARDALAAAVQQAGDDPALLDRLLKLELELEHWDAAIDLCYRLLRVVDADRADLRVTYRLTLGEIHVYGVRRPAAALLHYLEAVRLLPAYALTYTLLQELVEARGWPALADELARLPDDEVAPLGALIDTLREALEDSDDVAAALGVFRAAAIRSGSGTAA